MPFSRANGLEIYYEKAGQGPPLMMIHALPFNHDLWRYQVGSFSKAFTVYSVDLRGWGRSAKPRAPFSLRDMGADVLGLLADEGVKTPAVLMGCSIGSKIALQLACEQPELVSAAIIVGGNAGKQDFTRRKADYRSAAAQGTFAEFHRGHLRHGVTVDWASTDLGAYFVESFVDQEGALDAECIAHVFGALEGADLMSTLPDCRVPVLVVNGEHDSALEPGARTAAAIPGARRQVIEGAGHCCFLEKPWIFDACVGEFLRTQGLWRSA